MTCTTHHDACKCRQPKIDRLVEAAEEYLKIPIHIKDQIEYFNAFNSQNGLRDALADVKAMYEGRIRKLHKGTKVKLVDSSKDRAKWGNNDLPLDYLVIDNIYTIDHCEIHSCHTKVFLKEAPGKKFNSTHFEVMEEE